MTDTANYSTRIDEATGNKVISIERSGETV